LKKYIGKYVKLNMYNFEVGIGYTWTWSGVVGSRTPYTLYFFLVKWRTRCGECKKKTL
jgi:hypothetical protein